MATGLDTKQAAFSSNVQTWILQREAEMQSLLFIKVWVLKIIN